MMRAFTGQLERVGSDAWDSAVSALREMGLLNREIPDVPGTLDAEPLIREHFRDQLRQDRPDLWLQGNRVLFDYYQRQAPRAVRLSRNEYALCRRDTWLRGGISSADVR